MHQRSPKIKQSVSYQRLATAFLILIFSPASFGADIAPLFATFSFADQKTVRVFVTAPEACRAIREIASGKSKDKIPNGILLDDRPAKSPYDPQWSWHFKPDSIEMAEFTIEVCDATPTYVEEHLEDWFQGEKIARWCPWSAHLIKIEDLLYGDVNHDGQITIEDVRLALKILIGLISPTESQQVASDVYPSQGINGLPGDGRITPADVIRILQISYQAGQWKSNQTMGLAFESEPTPLLLPPKAKEPLSKTRDVLVQGGDKPFVNLLNFKDNTLGA